MSIQGGFISAATAGALGDGSGTNVLGLAGGGLQATGSFSSGRPVTVSGAGNSIDVSNGNTVTFNGAFTMNASSTLAKTGAGTLTLGAMGLSTMYGASSALN